MVSNGASLNLEVVLRFDREKRETREGDLGILDCFFPSSSPDRMEAVFRHALKCHMPPASGGGTAHSCTRGTDGMAWQVGKCQGSRGEKKRGKLISPSHPGIEYSPPHPERDKQKSAAKLPPNRKTHTHRRPDDGRLVCLSDY